LPCRNEEILPRVQGTQYSASKTSGNFPTNLEENKPEIVDRNEIVETRDFINKKYKRNKLHSKSELISFRLE
jgi:hypothetical protein